MRAIRRSAKEKIAKEEEETRHRLLAGLAEIEKETGVDYFTKKWEDLNETKQVAEAEEKEVEAEWKEVTFHLQRGEEHVVLHPNDVLSPNWSEHPGNVRFQIFIQALKPIYQSKQSNKRAIVDKFVSDWHTAGIIHATGGRFLKQVNGRWKELDNDAARERCIHALES